MFKALTIKGVYGREIFETWYKMIAMLENGLDVRKVITHRFGVGQFEEAFRGDAVGAVGQGGAGLGVTSVRPRPTSVHVWTLCKIIDNTEACDFPGNDILTHLQPDHAADVSRRCPLGPVF